MQCSLVTALPKDLPEIVVRNRQTKCGLLIFDKDGTIVDHSHWLERYKKRVELIVKNNPHRDELRKRLFKALGIDPALGATDPSGPSAELRDKDLSLVLATALYEHGYSFREALEIVEEAYRKTEVQSTSTPMIRALPGVSELTQLAKAKSIKLGLATLDDKKNTLRDLKTLGMSKVFDAIVTVDMVKHHKPNPEMIETLCKQLGIRPSRAVIIGDSTGDLIMGRNAGVALTVGICDCPNFAFRLEKYADVVISSYSEMGIP